MYPSTAGIATALRKNIDDYLIERCGFAPSKAPTLRAELFKIYGSSLAGLRALGYNIDADDYHSFVHGRLPYDAIKADQHLQNLIRTIPLRKIIFTNSDHDHAMKVLNRLGVQDCFEQIICFETLNPNLSKSATPDEFPVLLKPSPEAFKIAVDVAELDPTRTLFLDDNVKNIVAGKAAGFCTALIGKTMRMKEADYEMEKVNELSKKIPEIWAKETDGGDERKKKTTKNSGRSEVNAVNSASVATTTKVGA